MKGANATGSGGSNITVSIPLRGNLNESPDDDDFSPQPANLFPSPCGVSGMKVQLIAEGEAQEILGFPSPCGVSGMKDQTQASRQVSIKVSIPLRGKWNERL